MKAESGRLRGFLILGAFIFLFILLVEGPSGLYPHPFFTPLEDMPRRLPLSIAAGLIGGLIYALSLKKKP
jgi:hypothetical protein